MAAPVTDDLTEQLAHALCDHECDPGWWEKTDEEEREHYRRTIRALLSSGPLADRLAQADQDAAALARVQTVPAKLEAQKGSVQGNVARLLAAQRIRTALRGDR
jgi:hypothetical protein